MADKQRSGRRAASVTTSHTSRSQQPSLAHPAVAYPSVKFSTIADSVCFESLEPRPQGATSVLSWEYQRLEQQGPRLSLGSVHADSQIGDSSSLFSEDTEGLRSSPWAPFTTPAPPSTQRRAKLSQVFRFESPPPAERSGPKDWLSQRRTRVKQSQSTNTSTHHQTTTNAAGVKGSNSVKMVREREPPRPSQTQPDQIPQVPRPSATQALKNLTNTTPSPQFGQASPLRNPLKKDDQFRQPNVSRPVAPKAPSNNIFMMPRAYPSLNAADGRLSTGSNASLVEVPRPPTHQTMVYQSNPKPMFSSLNPPPLYNAQPTSNFYQPVNDYNYGLGQPRPTVDLTKDNDGFDPDEGLRNQDNFMDPDAYAYVDPLKAQESIKNLLEGAFDVDENKPRTRRSKKQQKDAAAGSSLVDGLNKLKVTEERPTEEDEDEEDDGTVEGLKVKLLPHQIQGLEFLIDKEKGERKKKAVLPKGGILADDMGLGKTIQALALLLSNPRPAKDAPEPEDERHRVPPKVGKGTLVVAPLALIKQWESEIHDKVEESHRMKVLVHHGPSRTKRFEELKKYDVVITTYNILTTEHAASSKDLQVGVFGVHWYRVILDEAHTIKNRNAKMTQACYNLKSHYRWCLTGTPMQNNLDELQSLIHFLDVKPYCELPSWRDHITQPMKNGRGNLAMRRLQMFLKALMLRRTKDIMSKEGAFGKASFAKDGKPPKTAPKMVKRDVESIVVDFDPAERGFYDRLATRAQSRLDEMMGGESTNYMAALVLLLRLRQACNHPELVAAGASKDKDALTGNLTQNGTQTPSKAKAESGNADDLADLLSGLSVAVKKCDVCMADLPAHMSKSGAIRCEDCEGDLVGQLKSRRKAEKHARKEMERKPRRNRRVIDDSDDEEAEGEWVVSGDERDVKDLGKAGGTDDEDAEGGGRSIGYDDSDTDDDNDEDSFANHKTKKHIKLVSSDAEEDSSPRKKKQEILTSSKIRRLLQILDDETPDHKIIVFSQFTSMLDLIEPFLSRAGHSFVRYDGSMRNDMREASLYSLRNDKRTRVLLCSLKCGSLGLNLTAASRVVILEPFWNPFVEEQAIDRVHRLNQTVDVKVYKLTVSNTVEERILDLQDAKRKLAKAALEGGMKKGANNLNFQDILKLFGHNAEAEHPEDGKDAAIFRRTRVLDDALDSAEGFINDERRAANRGKGNAYQGVGKIRERRPEDPVFGRR